MKALNVMAVVLFAGVGFMAYLIAKPSPPMPSGPAIRRATPAPKIPKTRAGFLACVSAADLDDTTRLIRAGDTASVDRMIERRQCVVLREGAEVTVIRTVSAGVVEFVSRGEPSVRFYTIREALR